MAASLASEMAAAESSIEAQKDAFADLGFEANAFETLERDFQEVLTELVRRPAAPMAHGPAVVAFTRHVDCSDRPSSANAACGAPTLALVGGAALSESMHTTSGRSAQQHSQRTSAGRTTP